MNSAVWFVPAWYPCCRWMSRCWWSGIWWSWWPPKSWPVWWESESAACSACSCVIQTARTLLLQLGYDKIIAGMFYENWLNGIPQGQSTHTVLSWLHVSMYMYIVTIQVDTVLYVLYSTHLERSWGILGNGACNRSSSSFLSGLKIVGSGIGGRHPTGTYLKGPVTLGAGSVIGGASMLGGVFSLEETAGSDTAAVGSRLGTFL